MHNETYQGRINFDTVQKYGDSFTSVNSVLYSNVPFNLFLIDNIFLDSTTLKVPKNIYNIRSVLKAE
jgi:hypothetical protein